MRQDQLTVRATEALQTAHERAVQAGHAQLEPLHLLLATVDAVEIMVALEKKYRLRIVPDETGRKAFRTLETLAELVTALKETNED